MLPPEHVENKHLQAKNGYAACGDAHATELWN